MQGHFDGDGRRAAPAGVDMEGPDASSPTLVAGGDLEARSLATIRTLAMDAVEAAQSGHPGTPMGLAGLAYALWTHGMRYAPSDPSWPDRDRFVLSCGHASLLQYALLHLTGYDLPLEDLRRFRQWGSKAAGHPEYGHCPGVETTTGPLGQGFANAVGMALAERMFAARVGERAADLVDHRVWVVASDGDLMEGISAEAAALAGHLGLSRLCVFWDDNRITIDGATDLAFTEDVAARFRAVGWNVLSVPFEAGVTGYKRAIDAAMAETSRPTFVACRTHIGYGAPTKQDRSAAHGAPLGASEVAGAKRAYQWPEEARFWVPDDVREHLAAAGRRGEDLRKDWLERLERLRGEDPAAAALVEAVGRPDAFDDEAFQQAAAEAIAAEAKGKALATRQASGKAIAALATLLPGLVGGSADLAGSNQTRIPQEGAGDIRRGQFAGRNIHFGVREHAMAAMLSGMALHGGFIPFGGTFLVFSDYMRPAIRLAALMGLRAIYVFTHDSLGVGEDGPTHQPIEHLAALRAIPNLHVVRPADTAETFVAWRAAVLRTEGPTALILTRQAVRKLDRTRFGSAAGLLQGAYVLREGAVRPDVALLATGSEVGLAIDAAERLQTDGIAARVVSMPCWERIDAAAFERCCGSARARVGVEAGIGMGWHRWLGRHGRMLSVESFGASAPGDEIMARMGLAVDRVVELAREALAEAEQAEAKS